MYLQKNCQFRYFLMPCRVVNFSCQPVDAFNSWSATSVFNCVEKCFTFYWRSGPEITVPLDLCWINRAHRAFIHLLSSASFWDFHFDPSLVSMLSVNFRILSLFFRMSEICCLLMPILKLNLYLSILYPNVKYLSAYWGPYLKSIEQLAFTW